uniref:Uncharacterized protein n=1 Tax=Anguilla anguilla TaxID=7936 RepID=A0A0E9SHR4_ANGAN
MHWHILSSNASLNSTFQNLPWFSYKRASNLENMLVKSDVVKA